MVNNFAHPSQQHPQQQQQQQAAPLEKKPQSLHMKVASGHRTAIRKLLREDNVQIDSRNSRDETPLHLAAAVGDAVVCELLIKAGANIYTTREDGMTPLHIATMCNNGTWS